MVELSLNTSFFGPMLRFNDSLQRRKEYFPSLVHWLEAAKFSSRRPDLHECVLQCPTIKEARKFTRARTDQWRSDWTMIQHNVVISGLAYMALDNPLLQLSHQPHGLLYEGLEPLGLPARLLEVCIDRFLQWGASPNLGAYGSDLAPESFVGTKMSKIVRAEPAWTLVSLCNNKAGWQLHDWAHAQYVPIRYVGKTNSRTTPSLLSEYATACDRLVVFETKGGKSGDKLIRVAKALKKPVVLELYKPEQNLSLSMSGSLF